ncbi:reverse transcriptase domain-containing protein [Tanacetum coccineum]
MALFKMKASINGAEVFSVDVLQEQQRAKSPKAGSNVDFGGVLIDVLTSIVEKVQSFISAIKALSRKEIHYGAYATSEQVKAAGDLCTICQEKMHAPVVLRYLEEFCENHYEKLLPIMADKYEYEQRKKEKFEEVKVRLDFGEARKKSTKAQELAYSESRTMSSRRQKRSRSPRHRPSVFTSRGRSASAHSESRQESSRYTENHSESEDSEGGHWKSKSRRQKSSVEDDDLFQPWVCAETDPFTSRIRYFDFPKTRMPSHVKTYNGSEDPEDHLKIFQAAAKMERWVMPTWCHMFNSTLTGNARVWFDDLPLESIDSYNDLREAFLKNYLQQKKCIRDPIVLHNIKQRDGESTEDFIQRYKSESGNVKGAPKCMRISEFVHGITNPELIKRFHEKIPKIIDEMMQVATSFLQWQEAASNQERKKAPPAWKHQEGGHR